MRGIDLKRDRDRIDLWLHDPELLRNPDLCENPNSLPQEIMVLEDDEQAEIHERKVIVHVIDRCIARYSTHKWVCKTIAILLAFPQFWIAILRKKQWQTKKDWENQKHHVEVEFLQNRIDQDVTISVFELDAAESEIKKHV